ISPGAVVPVDVLQAAFAIAWWSDADELSHAVIPLARQILDLEVARHHRLLQSVAQDDVGGICDLVGVNTDEAALDLRVNPIEVVRLPGRAVAAEGIAQERRHELQELAAAADLHLDQERLTL